MMVMPRVLVVEDEQSLRRLVVEVLTRCGYEVLAASKGDEALRLLEDPEPPVALLLSDIIMPGMNGHELAARARQARPGIKVLLMSGYDDTVGAHDWPAAERIEKPFTTALLAQRVRETLDGERS